MKNFFLYKIIYLLDNREKKFFLFLIALTFIGGVLEYLGFVTLFPALIFITKNNNFYNDSFIANPLINFILSSKNPEVFLLILFLSIYLMKLLVLTSIILIQNKFLLDVKLRLSNILALDYLKNSSLLSHVKKRPEKLIANLTDEIGGVGQILLHVSTIFTDILLIISGVLFIFLVNYKIAIIIFFLMFLILSIYQISVKKIIKMKAGDRFEHNINRIEIINYIFNAFKEIKLFKKENFFLEKLNFSTKKNFSSLSRINIIQALPRVILDLIFVLLIFYFLFFIFYYKLNLQTYLPLFGIYMFAVIRIIPALIKLISSISLINFCTFFKCNF
jgi:ATP-binding cassette subfamily C protein